MKHVYSRNDELAVEFARQSIGPRKWAKTGRCNMSFDRTGTLYSYRMPIAQWTPTNDKIFRGPVMFCTDRDRSPSVTTSRHMREVTSALHPTLDVPYLPTAWNDNRGFNTWEEWLWQLAQDYYRDAIDAITCWATPKGNTYYLPQSLLHTVAMARGPVKYQAKVSDGVRFMDFFRFLDLQSTVDFRHSNLYQRILKLKHKLHAAHLSTVEANADFFYSRAAERLPGTRDVQHALGILGSVPPEYLPPDHPTWLVKEIMHRKLTGGHLPSQAGDYIKGLAA